MQRSRWIASVPGWSRARFGVFTFLVFSVSIALMVATGVCAALHYHFLQVLCGATAVAAVVFWFRIAGLWSQRRRDRPN